MLNPAYGSGPHPNGEESWGTGYYSKQDFIEILKYAKARHIEVIPELDFPGHARAAIVSMKARQKELISAGKQAEANEYILHDPNDASRYRSIQLYDDNVICVCQESTYRFLAKVTDEVISMYEEAGLSLEQVHIGGDEVPHPSKSDPEHGAWKKSPKCNALLESDDANNLDEKTDNIMFESELTGNKTGRPDIRVDDWLILECHKFLDPEEATGIYGDRFLKEHYKANIKYQWGTNISKFGTLTLPGGVQLNGAEMKQEAQVELDKMRQELEDYYREPMTFLIG